MKTLSSDMSKVFFFALCLWAFVIDVTLGQPPGNNEHQQRHLRQSYGSAQTSSVESQGANNQPFRRNIPTQCDYKDLMTNIYDRVQFVASLDEDQRLRLATIDQKLTQFESANMERLDSIVMQQIDFQKRLDAMEEIQRTTQTSVEDLKGESYNLLKAISAQDGLRNQKNADFSRQSRQADTKSTRIDDKLVADIFNTKPLMPSVDQKLESLAILLTSTAANVYDLRLQLQSNITKLSKMTQSLNRRILGHKRRGHDVGAIRQAGLINRGEDPADIVTSCFQADPVSEVGVVRFQLTPVSDTFYGRCEENGWLVVLNRFSDNVNFERDWIEYKTGFGNIAGEFFIGLEKLHALTSSAVHELRVVVEDHNGIVAEAGYNLFAIGSESEEYALILLGEFNNGSAGDSLSYHAGAKFSTFDHDNDGCIECNCAASHKGGWWFNFCATSNLMGNYFTQDYDSVPKDQGMFWQSFRNSKNGYSLKKAKLLIRPVNGFEESR